VAPPAAGKGAPARVFAKVDNREIFMRAIELYATREQVVQRVFCVGIDDMDTVREKYSAHLAFQGVQVTAGGPDWFGVVARGLEKLKPEIDTVIVHDAARPAVPYLVLDALEETYAKHAPAGAAGVAPVLMLGEHVARVEGPGGALGASADIGGYVEVQSPQIFGRQALTDALAKRAGLASQNPQDDAALVRLCGGKVLTVPGSAFNVRVASDDVLKLAADYLKHMPKPRKTGPITPFDEAQW